MLSMERVSFTPVDPHVCTRDRSLLCERAHKPSLGKTGCPDYVVQPGQFNACSGTWSGWNGCEFGTQSVCTVAKFLSNFQEGLKVLDEIIVISGDDLDLTYAELMEERAIIFHRQYNFRHQDYIWP